jgi:ferredoxin
LLLPSTLAFFATHPGTLVEKAHGYIYTRFARLYIGTAIHRMKPRPPEVHGQPNWSSNTYHGKVVTLDGARQLLTLNEDIRRPDLEQIIPYPTARDLIVNNPDSITIYDCPCRMARPNPCQPIDVCMIVGEPFASFMLEHHPGHSRRVTQDEAVRILEEEHGRGHIHAAYFKDAMQGRFYAICNCCACCCGALQAMRYGTPMVASSGYVAAITPDACAGCGACVQACPFGAIRLDGVASVDHGLCMGCGVCVTTCPQGIPHLVRDTAKPEPLEVRTLLERERGDGW